jgi:hypothetical protein
MATSFVVSLAAMELVRGRFPAGDLRADAWVMLITVAVSTVVWLAVTFATAPEPEAVLQAFYLRVRPGGPGWARVSAGLGLGREPIPGGALAWTNWVAGIVGVYSALFGIGKLVFGHLAAGLVLLAVAAAAFALIARNLRRIDEAVGEQRPLTTAVPPFPEPALAAESA